MNKKLEHYALIILIFSFISCEFSDKTNNDDLLINVADKRDSSNKPIYDRLFYEQWAINKNDNFYKENNINENAHINMGNLLSKYSGKGITIAIIDNGLNDKHNDLKDSIIATYNSDTKTKNNFNPDLGITHATSVTGIIGARKNGIGILGIAYQAKLIFLKLGSGANATDTNLISIFNKAVELGADIINCSWGSYDVSDIVKSKLIDLATNGRGGKGIPIVFASGNDAKNMGNDESNIKEMISVGATNTQNVKARYTNFGENLDFMVPGGYRLGITTLGSNVFSSTYKLSKNADRFIGTSAAAPIVSGIIALMLEKNPELTRVEIETILKETSDKIGILEYLEDRNNYYGYGKINVSNAMDKITKLEK